MKDREFLIWLHARLEYLHQDNPCTDFMYKLRAIIKNMDKDQLTPNMGGCNSMEELLKELQ